jgi:transglutaminase-like putative cysteine protease
VAWAFWVTSRLLPADLTWLERWQNLAFRLNYWYGQAVQGGTSYDNMMFILQMGVIVWGMGYLTIWFIFRSGWVWLAVVPGGLVLLINLYYAPNDITIWFLAFIVLSLLLAIRTNLYRQELQWRNEGVFFRPDISFDFLRDGLVFSILLVALTWLIPPLASAQAVGPFSEIQATWSDWQTEWNRLFADLNYKNTGQVGVFGTSFSLGGPRRLTQEPVMNVKVEGPGRYWRATVYDQFTGFGWRNTDAETTRFGPEDPLSLPVFEARTLVTQTYSFYRDQATLIYALGQPISLDRTSRVTYNGLSNQQIARDHFPIWMDRGEPWVEEMTYIRSSIPLASGESYQVVSAASRATVSQLQNAGNDYPDWVLNRYLQLPGRTTERTRQLALDLAEGQDNAFDRARMIENYLRTEIKYNELISAPPSDRDKVDYILFQTKEAYCDYYASAMIVMLRSVGIPARLAVGFAQGDYNPATDAYEVVNADAHSWVEVYFPKYGWIEFEPTASQPAIVRPIGPAGSAGLGNEGFVDFGDILADETGQTARDRLLEGGADVAPGLVFTLPFMETQVTVPGSVISGTAILLAGFILVALGGMGWWWRQQARPAGDIYKLYQRMLRLAAWMGLTMRPWQTPYEHASQLQRRLPERQGEIGAITSEYVHHLFSPTPAAAPLTAASQLAWRRLYPAMVKAVFKRRRPRWLKF